MLNIFRHVVMLGLGLLALAGFAAHAKSPPVYTAIFSKTAVGGFDTVAYFTEKKPVKGESRFAATYKGVEWHFSSAENRDKFKTSPDQYAPQYGGYCAWAVSQGDTASGDPQYWKIVNDKLFLNYDADVQKKWETNIAGFIKLADANWPAVLEK